MASTTMVPAWNLFVALVVAGCKAACSSKMALTRHVFRPVTLPFSTNHLLRSARASRMTMPSSPASLISSGSARKWARSSSAVSGYLHLAEFFFCRRGKRARRMSMATLHAADSPPP